MNGPVSPPTRPARDDLTVYVHCRTCHTIWLNQRECGCRCDDPTDPIKYEDWIVLVEHSALVAAEAARITAEPTVDQVARWIADSLWSMESGVRDEGIAEVGPGEMQLAHDVVRNWRAAEAARITAEQRPMMTMREMVNRMCDVIDAAATFSETPHIEDGFAERCNDIHGSLVALFGPEGRAAVAGRPVPTDGEPT